MLRIFTIVVFLLCLFSGTVFAEDLIGAEPQGDLALEVTLVDQQGRAVDLAAVKGIATVVVDSPQAGPDQLLSLAYAVGDVLIFEEGGFSFPHSFKWNFKGLLPGPYTLIFKAKDEQGNIAAYSLNIIKDEE